MRLLPITGKPFWQSRASSASRLGLTLLAAAVLLLGATFDGSAAGAQQLSAQDAYRQVLAFAAGIRADQIGQRQQYLDDTYQRLERAAYRFGIIPEFALAIVAAEAHYGKRISWARYDSWAMYELTTGRKLGTYPNVLDDMDTALSELSQVMNDSKTVDDVFSRYWCGPRADFNKDSYSDFNKAASKLWNGLEPYARQRIAQEDRSKYAPKYDDRHSSPSAWAGLAYGDLEGYASQLGSMPALASQLKPYPEHEDSYIGAARKFNKKLSDDEARVIVRAILTYSEQTGWVVDPRLVMAVVAAESSFRPGAVSSCGALGLGQLMPATARGFGIHDPLDPIQNLYGCVKYLERETYRWRNNDNWLDLVAASYNAGPGAVKKYGGVPPYRETQSYVKIVKGYYFKLAPEKRR